MIRGAKRNLWSGGKALHDKAAHQIVGSETVTIGGTEPIRLWRYLAFLFLILIIENS
jgi:hypothetical protein